MNWNIKQTLDQEFYLPNHSHQKVTLFFPRAIHQVILGHSVARSTQRRLLGKVNKAYSITTCCMTYCITNLG